VPKFDRPGRVVRVDHKRNVAVVSLGLGQWEVPLDEVFHEGQGAAADLGTEGGRPLLCCDRRVPPRYEL
jgi:hypothetical protein